MNILNELHSTWIRTKEGIPEKGEYKMFLSNVGCPHCHDKSKQIFISFCYPCLFTRRLHPDTYVHRLVAFSAICGMESLHSVICSVQLNLLLYIMNYEQPEHFSGKEGTPYPRVIWLELLDLKMELWRSMKVVFRTLKAIVLARTNSVSHCLLQFWGLDIMVYVQTIAITATCKCLLVASCLIN